MPDLMPKTENNNEFQDWLIELEEESLSSAFSKEITEMASQEAKAPRLGFYALAGIPSTRCWKTELIKALFYRII
jgi:hypothetical protein